MYIYVLQIYNNVVGGVGFKLFLVFGEKFHLISFKVV